MKLMVVDNESMGYPVVLGRDFLRQSGTRLVFNNTDVNRETDLRESCYLQEQCKDSFGNDMIDTSVKGIDERILKTEDTDDKDIGNNDFERQMLLIKGDEDGLEYDLGELLNFRQKIEFKKLFEETYLNPERPDEPLTKCEMRLIVDDTKVFNYSPRRLSYSEKAKLQIILDEYLAKGFIRPSESEYASPIVLVKKKTGDLRMCVDFRQLNKVTTKKKYPIPLIDDLLDKLVNKSIFSKLDLKNGYYHVYMHEESIKYTSFTTPLGQFEFLRMPFGLTNAPFTFQRFINKIFSDMVQDGRLIIYMDDIMVATQSIQEHMEILKAVFKRLVDNKLELRLDKCFFFQSEVKYLGYMISKEGIKADNDGVKAILDFPVPTKVQEVQSFIGMCSYFRRFIKDFSVIAKPLHDLTKKDGIFKIGPAELDAFGTLKRRMVSAPILALFDPKDETELHCDASSIGFGAILLQKKGDGKFHPIFYFSKRTTETESRYHSFELETLAIVYALKRFRVYLQGRVFKIVTDCNSLTLTLNKKELNPRIARWALELQDYEYTLEHRSGERMKHVDALSRCNTILAIQENTFEDNLVICQSKDDKLNRIREMLSNGEHELYEMRNGVIYRKVKNNLVFCVPEAMENQVLFKYHNEMGHVGTDKVTDIINKSYWFPNIRKKVQEHIGNCLKCIAFSNKSGKQEGFLHIVPKGSVPFQIVHVDHYGPINSKDSVKKHILVVVDACTKFVRLYPTKSTTSKEAIDALEDYFRAYSRPSHIVSDRGTCFTSGEFENFLRNNNIVHIKIATGSPQANGQVERINRDLGPMISKLLNVERREPWYKVLHQVEYAMNNTVHRSINQYPSVMLFGTAQRGTIVDSLKENVVEKEQKSDNKTVNEIRDKAEEVQKQIQDYNKSYVDGKRRSPNVYKKGDYVMVRNFDSTVGVSSKLLPKFKGPFEIHKVLDKDRYCVRDIEGFQRTQRPYEGIWAVQNIRPWLKTNIGEIVSEGDPEDQNLACDSKGVLETNKNDEIIEKIGVTTRGMLKRCNMISKTSETT